MLHWKIWHLCVLIFLPMLVIIKISPRKRFSIPEIIRPIRTFVGLFFFIFSQKRLERHLRLSRFHSARGRCLGYTLNIYANFRDPNHFLLLAHNFSRLFNLIMKKVTVDLPFVETACFGRIKTFLSSKLITCLGLGFSIDLCPPIS